MIDLKEKVAIITGASGGIGRSISLRLAREGVHLVLIGRDESKLKNICREGRKKNIIAEYLISDFNQEFEVQEVIKRIKTSFPVINILAYCAGIFKFDTIKEYTYPGVQELFNVGVIAPYILTKYLLPLFEAKAGYIFFINSTAGLISKAKTGIYSATKFALRAIADSIRQEANENGIRVMSIYLGRTSTPMQQKIIEQENRNLNLELLIQPDEIADIIVKNMIIMKSAEITEIMLRPIQKSY